MGGGRKKSPEPYSLVAGAKRNDRRRHVRLCPMVYVWIYSIGCEVKATRNLRDKPTIRTAVALITLESRKASIPITVRCDEAFDQQGRWLADLVASFDDRGPGLADGVTLQVGWSVLRLAVQGDGSLLVCEPDFAGNALSAFRPEVSTTLSVLKAQVALAKQVGLDPKPSRYDDKVVIYKGVFDMPAIYADRQPPKEGDSGWYIGPAEMNTSPGADDLEAIRVYHLLTRRPHLMAALALPPGCIVAWNGTTIKAVFDPDGRNLWPGVDVGAMRDGKR